MKVTVSKLPFKSITIGDRFICLKTYKSAPFIFKKIEDVPAKHKWSIHSNALMFKYQDGREAPVPVHFMDKIECVLVSEFEKQGIKL